MGRNTVFIKKGDEDKKIQRTGKLYRMMVKSDTMEAIIAELEPHVESRWYKHGGEEIHLMLSGKMEYTVDDHSYIMTEGDTLWHPSTLKHRAKNLGDEKAVYLTVGTPPTFM